MAGDSILYLSPGLRVDHTPSGAVTGGDIVVQGNLVGVASQDIAAAEKGSLAVGGLFRLAKATTGVVPAAGDHVWYNTSSKLAVLAAGSNCVYFGKTPEGAAEATAYVDVVLIQATDLAEADAAALVTPTQDALTDSSGGSAATTLAALTNLAALTLTGMTGTAATTPAAEVNLDTLTLTNMSGTANTTPAAETNLDALTLTSMSGTANTTPAAETNIDTLTGTLTGTLDNILADVAAAAGACAGDATPSAANVDTAIATAAAGLATGANKNFKEMQAELTTQRALNTVLVNDAKLFAEQLVKQKALNTVLVNDAKLFAEELVKQRAANIVLNNDAASLAAQLAKVKTDVAAILTSLKNAEIMKSA